MKGLRVLELSEALNVNIEDLLAVCAILNFKASSRLSMLSFEECKKITDYYENNIEGYSKLILEGFQESLSNPYQSDVVDTTVNNMPAKLTTLSGKVEGIDAFYSIGIYEGKDRYYQVLAWTLKSKQYSYKSKMDKILYSLKELNPIENVQ